MPSIDDFVIEFDRALRAVAGVSRSARATPGQNVAEADLSDEDRNDAAALMLVNHCGEVCAQALYQGQALASGNPELKRALAAAAREEEDHLAWTARRIEELGGRTSFLNPLWYAGALTIGLVAGKAGDAWNLGFLKETERQVEAHLQGHLDRLTERDGRTRAIVEQMKVDEAGHAATAARLGARELPLTIKAAMRLAAKVMTTVSYRV